MFRYLGVEGAKGVRVSDYETGVESVFEVEQRDFLTMDLVPGKHLFELHSKGWRTQLPARPSVADMWRR